MIKHGFTPTKWEVRTNGVFVRVVHGDHKTTVADGIASEANARLIAASPTLLEALQNALAAGLPGIVAAEARAAIALAIGKDA